MFKRKLAVMIVVGAFAAAPCFAKGHHSGVYYGGGHHTHSHGGHYAGSHGGSSHKGGHYRNLYTGNHYGRHK